MTHVRQELRVEICRLGNRYQAVTCTVDGDVVTTHEFQYETGSLVRGSLAHLSGSTDTSPGAEPASDPVQVAAQGWELYRNFFGNNRALRDYLAAHRDARPCQLTLSLGPGTASLARLPWEYLYNGDAFLCLSGNLPVSHRPYGLDPIRPQATPLPLRILLVLASPEDQPSFEVEQELALLHKALAKQIRSGAICLDVLAEATSASLREAARSRPYHVIHYVGHGIHQLPQREGFLCLEDNPGHCELVAGSLLPPLLGNPPPSLVLLSSCPSADFGVADAFAGVAQDLLVHGISAALSIPSRLGQPAARAFYKAFYSSLADGETVAESVFRGRAFIKRAEDEGAAAKRQFGWAIPVLYQRDPDLQLIQAGEVSRLPEQGDRSTFRPERAHSAVSLLGRTPELRAVSRALQNSARIFYVWGSEGMGKRSFVSHLTQHLARRPSGTLRVRCSTLIEPLSLLAKIADFWRSGGSDVEEEAAHLLLDVRQDPFERAQKAQQLVKTKRLLLIFENIDRWFVPEGQGLDTIANDIVRTILLGLIAVPSKSLFFFTGTRRWKELAELGNADIREIYLPLLSAEWAVQVMNGMPDLRPVALTQKYAIHWHIGGHPRSLALLAGWLQLGQDLESLLASSPIEARSTELWQQFLIGQILRQLDPGEFQVLQALAVLPYPASAAILAELTPVAAEYTQPLLEHWCRLGILETLDPDEEDTEVRFCLYRPVRDAVIGRMSSEEIADLHLQAATHCGAPFVDAAWRQVLARNITAWTRDRIEWLARDTNGILGTRLRQEHDPVKLQSLLSRALAWQHHLLQAGRIEEATQIVQAIAPVLKQQLQTNLSEALMRRSPKLSSHPGYTTGVDQLAQLRLEEGSLTAALDVYRQVYESLDAEEVDLQRAHVLMRAGAIQQRLGDVKDAIESFEWALKAMQREGNREGEAECLFHLATLRRETGEIRQALVYSQAAKEYYETSDSSLDLAIIEREQGLILKELGHLESALECFTASLRICRRLGHTQGVTEALIEIGLILQKSGRNEMAIQVIEEALQHYEYLRGPEHSEILKLLQDMYTRKKQFDEALAKLRAGRAASRAAASVNREANRE
jgi:tetratricopeptide (TPR) repeat protein